MGPQISEWEKLSELKHLQLLLAEQPYFGRELRYFNQAPWWYRYEFDLPNGKEQRIRLRFTNVDYYCKIWINGQPAGEHEGYSAPSVSYTHLNNCAQIFSSINIHYRFQGGKSGYAVNGIWA